MLNKGHFYVKIMHKMPNDFSQTPFYRQVQKHSCISDVLADQGWWCNIKRCLSYSKNYICNLYVPIHGIITDSTFIRPFESATCGKDGKKLQKLEYLEKEDSPL